MLKKNEKNQAHFTFTLRRGLGRTLFVSFMLLSFIPLLVAGWFSYHNAHSSLLKKEVNSLQTALSLRSLYFESYFQERLNDLVLQADLSENIFLLKELQAIYSKKKLPLARFVKSYDFIRIITEYSQDLQDFKERAGYSDIYLIDIEGNILFSVAADEDLGTNLFHGPHRETELATVYRLAIETGHPLCSDLALYGPAGKEKTLFTAQLMVDESGEEIGVLVMQIKLQKINDLMADISGLGETGQVFLVGNDGILRSNLRNAKSKQVLSSPINNVLVTQWLEREEVRHSVSHDKKDLVSGNYEGVIYMGQSGNNVLGISTDLDSLGQYDMHWLMIAEIDEAEALAAANNLRSMLITIFSITVALILLIAAFLTRRMIMPLLNLTAWAKQISAGDLAIRKMNPPSNEIGTLYQAVSDMVGSLREMIKIKDRQDWLKTGETGLNKEMRGEGSTDTVGQNIISYLCQYLDLPVGAFFAYENDKLCFTAGYACKLNYADGAEFVLGEGLVGQVAQDRKKIYLQNVPENYLNLEIRSGLGALPPQTLLLLPLVCENRVQGVLEFGSNRFLTEEEINFLEHISESAAIAIQSANSRQQLHDFLQQTQDQAEELQAREEELTVNNRELERANKELERTGAELEEHSSLLQDQAVQLKRQQEILKERNKKIELSNKYKSEFMANMSHELRTPLNSILLLSSLMADNKNNDLSEGDVESVKTINKAGNDLLNLINEVLDLAKVESGRMEIEVEDVKIDSIIHNMRHLFQPICENNGIEYRLTIDDEFPQSFRTDQSRLEQILKNFLSNSCKFTKKGGISLRMSRVKGLETELLSSLPENFRAPQYLAFSVTDTGVGIAKEKQDLIFEAFHQEDGGTRRQYGGTGLGLSISREIAKYLGGHIALTSEPGHGSTFALIVPEQSVGVASNDNAEKVVSQKKGKKSFSHAPETVPAQKVAPYVVDDRKNIQDDDKILLIIDDDPDFAKIVLNMAREQQFKVLVAENGESGLQLADLHQISAIVLDIELPGMSGWSVLSRLKESSATRHIPVHVISASDRDSEALKMGALNFLTKPVDARVLYEALAELKNVGTFRRKKLLIVEDDASLSQALNKFFMSDDIELFHADSGAQALAALKDTIPDCVILDLGLPDMDGEYLLQNIQEMEDLHKIPIIVYTGRDLTSSQKALLDQYSRKTIMKDGGSSYERLLAEITLFMHRVEKDLPAKHQEIIQNFYNREDIFIGKKILLVDDDMRNVFSLRKILADKSMKVVVAKHGQEALEQLKNNPDVNLVLMDIMMPVMDGFEAMAKIRQKDKFKKLPIIALTAKAMKGDRKKCIDAGASDYLTKPIDKERLFSLLRVWLYGQE